MSEAVSKTSAGAVVEKLLAAFGAADADALQPLFDPNVEVIEPAGLPYGGVYKGAAAFFEQLLPAIAGPFELTVSDSRVFDGGDAAAANMVLSFTSRRTGETIHMPYVEIYRVADGLITQVDVYPQDVTALAAFMDANR
jgi:ketosteroid isomerase-like protein